MKLIPLPREIERSTETEQTLRLRIAALSASTAVCQAGRIVSLLHQFGAGQR